MKEPDNFKYVFDFPNRCLHYNHNKFFGTGGKNIVVDYFTFTSNVHVNVYTSIHVRFVFVIQLLVLHFDLNTK